MSTTRKALFTLAALGLTAFAAHPASAQTLITGLYDTGVDAATGTSLANGTVSDPNYTLSYLGLDGTSDPVALADEVRTSAGGFPIPPYLGDSTTSAFIGPTGPEGSNPATYDLSGPQGIYEYTTTFTVSGLTLGSTTGSALITGNWATDNGGTDILINGVSTGSKTDSATEGFRSYTPFTINAANLHDGLNTLTFVVANTEGVPDNPTALRVDGINASAAPEPSQIGVLALAALGLGALAVKARKRSTAAQAA